MARLKRPGFTAGEFIQIAASYIFPGNRQVGQYLFAYLFGGLICPDGYTPEVVGKGEPGGFIIQLCGFPFLV